MPGCRFKPDAPIKPFNDFLAYRQTDSGPLVLIRAVETLKNIEDAVRKLWFNSDPIVLHGKEPGVFNLGDTYVYFRWNFAAKLDCVADQGSGKVGTDALSRL